MAAEEATSKVQAWFCTGGLPSDIVVEVDGMAFHLHKFPLTSKSKKLHDLVTEQETNPARVQMTSKSSEKGIEKADDNDDGGRGGETGNFESEIEQGHCRISLPNFPGGSETFETAAKFCYGVKIDLSASNVAPLRCAGEVLEMTEEYSEHNLVSKTEGFLCQRAFRNVKHSIEALKSCERILPLAENLGIVQRCIDAISSMAALVDPSLLGWPVKDVAAAASRKKTTSSTTKGCCGGAVDLWFDDQSILCLDFFKRLIFTMRDQDLNPDVIESCLINHAKKCFPGSARSNGKPSSSSVASDAEQREVLETIATNLPLEKSSIASTSTRFLFGLLRYANLLKASGAAKAALERKIGAQLEQATLDDLLIPSYSYLNETLYDIDIAQRMLGYFLESYKGSSVEADDANVRNVRSSAMMTVGKLVDGYLSEIASDANLKPERFYELAISLPAQGRLFDDRLYGAIDVYLKAHPWISEVERENICRAMDCHKLTLEACTHAAQNDRLPLCTVIQVLFVEQLQLRHAIAGTLIAADPVPLDSGSPSAIEGGDERGDCATEQVQDSSPWRATIGENQALRFDMSRMRSRVNELERMCWTMKKAIEKIDNAGPPASGVWRNSVGRKFGCKFKTQVCDSHESTVVVASKARHQSNRHRSSS